MKASILGFHLFITNYIKGKWPDAKRELSFHDEDDYHIYSSHAFELHTSTSFYD